MNLGEILDRTIQIYRSRFLVFAGIAALPALATFGIRLTEASWAHGAWTIHLSRQTAALWSFFATLLLYYVSGFLGLLVFPAQAHVASTTSLGEGSSVSTSLRFLVARWRTYVWVAALKSLVVVLIPEVLFVALAVGVALIAVRAGTFNNVTVMGPATALLFLALPAIAGCGLFLWLGGCFSLVVPACAIEGVGGFTAFRRSWALSKGSRARIIFSWLMIVVFSGLLMYGLSLGFRWVFPYLCRTPFLGALVRDFYSPAIYLLFAAVSTLTGSLYPIAATLFYYDQRIRHEGYDIVRMMEEAGMTAPSTPPVGDSPVASAEEEIQP
jgi:hypothetical protein